jgi:hypothetical protein
MASHKTEPCLLSSSISPEDRCRVSSVSPDLDICTAYGFLKSSGLSWRKYGLVDIVGIPLKDILSNWVHIFSVICLRESKDSASSDMLAISPGMAMVVRSALSAVGNWNEHFPSSPVKVAESIKIPSSGSGISISD